MRVEMRPPLQLGLAFLRIGAVAFGGLGTTLTLIERELVHRRYVTTKEEITEALTYTKLLPGSTVVQVVAYLGWRLGGWSDSALATAFFLLPSVVLMLALAYGYSQVADASGLVPIRRGVLAVVVGLLLMTMYNLAKPVLSSPVSYRSRRMCLPPRCCAEDQRGVDRSRRWSFRHGGLAGAGQVIHLELFARFLLISLIAFGGGQAALPLVEQMADSSAQSIAGRFTLSFTSTRQI
jgi:chromate transport protein ChrA